MSSQNQKNPERDAAYIEQAKELVDPNDFTTTLAYRAALLAKAARLEADSASEPDLETAKREWNDRHTQSRPQRREDADEDRIRRQMDKVRDEIARQSDHVPTGAELRRMAEDDIRDEDSKTDGMEMMYGH